MSRLYLGIDTSNYRTSAAIFDAETLFYQNFNRLLDVPVGAHGLRQSEALFQHTLHLHKQLARLPAGVGKEIRAVCASTRPRAVEGSYMPCFLAGEGTARSIAHLLDIPFYTASHQQGHLAAAALGAGCLDMLGKTFLAWHLSGGTTELLKVTPDSNGLPCAEIIGGTTDISAGQLVDRIGVLLGLGFPAGIELEQLAIKGEQKGFPVKVKDCFFSLSGMQNKAEQLHDTSKPAEKVARFVIETIAYAVVEATGQARKDEKYPVLCAGGVMGNMYIQQQMKEKFNAYFAMPELSGDNAVGAAILAAQQKEETLW